MSQVFERSLIRMGDGGLVVTLPPGWLRFHGVKPVDRVEVISNGKITTRPLSPGKEATRVRRKADPYGR